MEGCEARRARAELVGKEGCKGVARAELMEMEARGLRCARAHEMQAQRARTVGLRCASGRDSEEGARARDNR